MYKDKDWNAPLSQQLKDLHSPNNMVVKMAEQQLRQRFVGLDKENQISVLKHHLQRGKSCRDLAYIRLLSYWDEAFVPIITELWEACHEEKCSWVITKNYPLDFVKKHKEKLIAAGCKRKFIVQRLCENPDYRLSRSNLSDYDYLWLVSVTKRSISDTTAKEILWTTIKDICQSPIPPLIVNYVGRTDFEKLDKVLYHLEMLGKTEITESFMDWYSEVKNKIDVRNIQILHNILHDAIEMDDRNDPYNMLIDLLKQNLPSLCFSWNL